MTERIRYLEELRDLTLAVRGSGLCLSPLEVDLIDGWWADGVPLAMARDAIQEAALRHRASGRAVARRPFPLRVAAPLVEERFGAYVRRSGAVARREDVGATEARLEPSAARSSAVLAGLLHARVSESAGPIAAAYRAAALASTKAGDAPPDRVLAAADDAQARAYLQALPRAEQRQVARNAVRDAGPRGHVPRAAHRATLRVYLGIAARRHGRLDRPSDLA